MIYLDNSATTKPCVEAVEAMTLAMTEHWGNPSALYGFGIDMAKQLLLNSESSLSSISVECGFGTYINFYRSFTKSVGIPPAEWKRQHSKE